MNEGYLDRKEAAVYLHTSVRNLSRMKVPRYKVFGKALYKRSDLDAWMKSKLEVSDLDQMVQKVLRDLRRKPMPRKDEVKHG
ncbi:helix-turn-helix domain-containing protein [bacterium]|nr:helix-turn-helix domain-containing protein [bacterium]